MRDVSERLGDIQEAIARIMKYTNQGRAKFDQDELIQTWVVHHLEIIGEATRSIPKNFVFWLTDGAFRMEKIDVVGSEKGRRGLFPLPSFLHGA